MLPLSKNSDLIIVTLHSHIQPRNTTSTPGTRLKKFLIVDKTKPVASLIRSFVFNVTDEELPAVVWEEGESRQSRQSRQNRQNRQNRHNKQKHTPWAEIIHLEY